MFVNKINGFSSPNFKGYDHIISPTGKTIQKFNYVYDYDNETCEVQFFKVIPFHYTSTSNGELVAVQSKIVETPIATVQLKPEGVDVDLDEITNLAKNESYAYKIVRKDKNTGNVIWEGPDTGTKFKLQGDAIENRVSNDKGWIEDKSSPLGGHEGFFDDVNNYKYTYVSRNGTTPLNGGAGYLLIADSFYPGMKTRGFHEENTGEIYLDKDYQKETENIIKTPSNTYNGSIAGIRAGIPYLKQNGVTYVFACPIVNSDSVSGHGYLAEDNFKIAEKMGTTEDYSSLTRELYASDMSFVFDATLTAEGIMGKHFQYALRHMDSNPQTKFWFYMHGLEDNSLGFGIIPENEQNLRARTVNHKHLIVQQEDGTLKKVPNPNYDKNKPTYFQPYDKTQASESQIKNLDKAIERYENLKSGNELSIINHNDTVTNYIKSVNPDEIDARIDVINDLIKNHGKKISIDSAEFAELLGQFSDFKITKKTEGGYVAWDAKPDLAKLNYHFSNYADKLNQSIPDRAKRQYMQDMYVRGSKEVQDMALQVVRYWAVKTNDIQTIYTAQQLGTTKTVEGIEKLIKEEKLPKKASVTADELNNILNGYYKREPKGVLDRDDVTVKSLMKLPLDTLEFGNETSQVLSTSYFTNRATKDEQIGETRFELYKQKNPHLVDEYRNVYTKVNGLFTNELKNFAEAVAKKVDSKSGEKLFDSNGDYTEYGEYVMELVGQDIAKYALLKSLAGKNFDKKILPNGEITYDYKKIKENTTLEALGLKGLTPEAEADALQKKMFQGLKQLQMSEKDISFVANSISKRISGTDVQSFRLAEALVNKAGLGLNYRLDAAKDIMDQDAVRNREADFDSTWTDLIKFYRLLVSKGIKPYNPHSLIIAEQTDVPDVMRDTYGANSQPYRGETDIGGKYNGEPDAMTKFFNETGITTEAGYSYFFNDLLKIFSPEFEEGKWTSENHDSVKEKMELLIQTRNIDYIRNMYTFIGNHDKARVCHGLAIDMRLFHSQLLYNGSNWDEEHKQREDVIKVMSGTTNINEVPIELRLDVDNREYFRTVSGRASAQSKLLLGSFDEDLKNIASDNDIKLIKNALVDLANGNYLTDNKTEKMTRINIKELSSLRNACNAILKLAEKHGLNLSEADKQKLVKDIVQKANETDITKYLVRGDFDWGGEFASVGETNRGYLKEVLGTDSNPMKYSLYTVQLARLINDSYKQIGNSSAFSEAIKDFVNKYDRHAVSEGSSPIKFYEDKQTAMNKIGYAGRPLDVAIDMAIKQAEFSSGRKIKNKDDIKYTIYKSITEPAVQKAAMIMEFLKALSGIPTMYSGDEIGMTGYEEKANNELGNNRMVFKWSLAKDNNSEMGKLIQKYSSLMNGTLKDRADLELNPLNYGTPYSLDITSNSKTRDEVISRIRAIDEELKGLDEKSTKRDSLIDERRKLSMDLAKFAFLMQTGNGDITISLFNAGAIEHGNRVNYFKKYGLNSDAQRQQFFKDNNIDSINPNNKYVPIQPKSEIDAIMLGSSIALPIGTIFINANSRDKAKYVVKQINGKLGVVREDGKKIIMDGLSSKNGVMILKKIRKIAFKGSVKNNFYNRQYNIMSSNPYHVESQKEEGLNLKVLSKA